MELRLEQILEPSLEQRMEQYLEQATASRPCDSLDS